MNAQERLWLRLGVLTELVGRAPIRLGRTAIMKLAFLLQTVHGVPLGYDFRLFTYGPFDTDVLHNLGLAENLRAVASKMVRYPSAYGYEFSSGPGRNFVTERAGSSISKHIGAIESVIEGFGRKSAGDLELISTIVYADRDAYERQQKISPDDLCRQVREIKPRFPVDYVLENILSLKEKRLLLAVGESSRM